MSLTIKNFEDRCKKGFRSMYAMLSWKWRHHHERFKKRVLQTKVECPDCKGSGGEIEPILDEGTGPWFECGWCEGTGYVTPHLLQLWAKLNQKAAS